MDKRRLHHIWKQLKAVHYWYFLIAAVFCLVVGVYALRQNNLGAVRLREHVLDVDKANGDVEAALKELRGYIYSHMNSNLAGSTSAYPPIQLKYRYERLVKAEQDRVDAANKNNTVYNDAQNYCERTEPQSFFGAGRLGCIQRYIDGHPAGQTVSPNAIPDSLYKFDFVSPLWSPDLAGCSLLAAALLLLLFVARFGLELWFARQFKRHA
jgi:hypothetical protein